MANPILEGTYNPEDPRAFVISITPNPAIGRIGEIKATYQSSELELDPTTGRWRIGDSSRIQAMIRSALEKVSSDKFYAANVTIRYDGSGTSNGVVVNVKHD